MGVERSDWVVVGVDIGMEHYDDDNYDYFDQYAERKKVGDMTFLIDGMSSDYFIVGEVVLHAEDYNGFGVVGLPIADISKLNEAKERVKQFINLNFDIDSLEEPKLIILTHWT